MPRRSAVRNRARFLRLTVNAVQDDRVLGQVGVACLPMISIERGEDVGGVWAAPRHPTHSGRGLASALLKEAHTRMQDAGLRFSTLGTNRFCTAYRLYQQHCHQDMGIHATALTKWQTAHQPTRLCAQLVGPDGYDLVETRFADIAQEYFGFSRRHTLFARLRMIGLKDIWIRKENGRPVGYALVDSEPSLLTTSSLVLRAGVDSAEAVAAVTADQPYAAIDALHAREP